LIFTRIKVFFLCGVVSVGFEAFVGTSLLQLWKLRGRGFLYVCQVTIFIRPETLHLFVEIFGSIRLLKPLNRFFAPNLALSVKLYFALSKLILF